MDIKEKIINNRSRILTVIGVLLVLAIISGMAYAYFGQLVINNTANAITQINTSFYTFNTSGTSSISITLDQDQLDISNASNTYTSFVSKTGGNINITLDTKNSGTVYCTYDIVYEPTTAYTSSPAAVSANLKEFTISGTSTNEFSFDNVNVAGSSKVTLARSIFFTTDTNYTDSWQFTVNYYNLDVVQDNVIGQTFGGNIKVDNVNCGYPSDFKTGKDMILAYNGGKDNIEKKGNPDFTSIAETNEGMFAMEDDLGMSYYFRGAVDNNWLQYGEYTSDMYICSGALSKTKTGTCSLRASAGNKIYWRIIRINGNGSIRLLYAGTVAPTASTKVNGVTTTKLSIGALYFNEDESIPESMGYMYEEGKQHGLANDSAIKQYIDDWYANYTNLNNTGSKVTDQIFCNDRSASTEDLIYSPTNYTTLSTWSSTAPEYYFGPQGRIYNDGIPQLVCPINDDSFTVDKINGKGNSALNYPVGLLTSDEAILAGLNFKINRNNFLSSANRSRCIAYWIGSPFYYGDSQSYQASINCDVEEDDANTKKQIRGVISLSSDVKLSGKGTWDDVYTVSE